MNYKYKDMNYFSGPAGSVDSRINFEAWRLNHHFDSPVPLLRVVRGLFQEDCCFLRASSHLLHTIWMIYAGCLNAFKGVIYQWRSIVTNRIGCLDVYREVIESQPNVLILPEGRKHSISNWDGRVAHISASSFTPVLPFVGRHSEISAVVSTLLSDLSTAEKIGKAPTCIKSLRIVGSSAPRGSGQTTLGRVVHECLQKAVGEDQQVIYSRVNIAKRIFRIWTEDICSQPGTKGLSDAIDQGMSLRELLHETQHFLAAKNSILFLHFDDLAPFKKNGDQLPDSPRSFHDFWKEILKEFICTPRVCLYFSGQMAYFDNVSNSKINAFDFDPVEVGPLESADIHAALSKMFVADPASDEHAIRLSDVLDGVLSNTCESASWELARRLHSLTAGVPLYVEHALNALLADSAFNANLFPDNQRTALVPRMERLVSKDGAAYNAVRASAQAHFTAQFAAAHDVLAGVAEVERRAHLAHLLDLVLLQGKTLKLSHEGFDANYIRWAKSRYIYCEGVAALQPEARMWGVHRTFHLLNETIAFHLPPAVREGLARALGAVPELQPILQQLRRDASVADGISICAVETALAFHRRVGQVAKQANWLGLVPDRAASDGVVEVTTPGEYYPIRLQQPAPWQLQRLPLIHEGGEPLTNTAIVAIVNRESPEESTLRSCNPSSVARLLHYLDSQIFEALAARPGSTCADFVVYLNAHVTHVHVLESGPVTARTMLRACVNTLPLRRDARSCLTHTIAFIVSEREARAAAVREFASLSRRALATLLTAAAKAEADVGAETHEGSAASAAAVVPVAEASKAAALVKNTAAVADLLRNGTFTVVVLNDAQLARFFHYNTKVADLLGDVVGSA